MNLLINSVLNLNNCQNKRITVIGNALEDKDGAFILVEENGKNFKKGMYFIDGLREWDERFYGKKVKATGILIIEKHEEKIMDSIWVQQLVGNKAILKKAKWKLTD